MENQAFTVDMPKVCTAKQGQERFCVTYQGKTQELFTHDYDEIFKIPGLYEYLFHDQLKCVSPTVVCSLLGGCLKKERVSPAELVVLDVGAGNGMIGERLSSMGAATLLGLDILPEAAFAAHRDRPELYNDYFVEDLTRLTPPVEDRIRQTAPNCMTIVAALGFGDIPPQAFAQGYNLIADHGWVAFNIKGEFVGEGDVSGFKRLIHRLVDQGIMEVVDEKDYCHRLCQDGTPLHYMAYVARKREDIPEDLIESCNDATSA